MINFTKNNYFLHIFRFILILVIVLCNFYSCKTETKSIDNQKDTLVSENEVPLTYDLSLNELIDINVVEDKLQGNYSPTYDISIEDLMTLKIVKELKIDTCLTVSYDLPLEDLMKIDIPLHAKTNSLEPTYEMSLKGLLEFQISENQNITNKIILTYDLSLDGLMQIKIETPNVVNQ